MLELLQGYKTLTEIKTAEDAQANLSTMQSQVQELKTQVGQLQGQVGTLSQYYRTRMSSQNKHNAGVEWFIVVILIALVILARQNWKLRKQAAELAGGLKYERENHFQAMDLRINNCETRVLNLEHPKS